jgi:hypothetical protein
MTIVTFIFVLTIVRAFLCGEIRWPQNIENTQNENTQIENSHNML